MMKGWKGYGPFCIGFLLSPKKAETLLQDVSAKLEELTEKLPVLGCDDVIQEWQKEEVEALKPKEHDGQAIAIKLAKQINKVAKSVLKTLSEVNGYLPNDVPQILYDDAKDPKSSIYSEFQEEGDTVPALVRRQIIDHFCLHNRCPEELELLKEEMNRLVSFLQNEMRLLDESVDALLPHTDNPLNAGMIHCKHIPSLLLLWGGNLDSPKPIDDAEVAKA
ncbi:uncharacterized protein LOC111346726 [Stylophora pistillata]|uniref:uncharacterized protein LOC111346726 n=1 Tax=Stylophora pistillata TaxID=50429 RepID=UPI000C03DF32|nr:uncharacterized protein LOC111346726 [Stylophora pistillata]